MDLLAQWHNGAGPGPWMLFFPLAWAAVVAGGVLLLRRTVWRGRHGPWQPKEAAAPGRSGREAPLDLLARRFAQGEIDEDEYWRRSSALREGALGGGGES